MLTGSPALSFSLPLIAFFARSLFRSSSLTESLEQATATTTAAAVAAAATTATAAAITTNNNNSNNNIIIIITIVDDLTELTTDKLQKIAYS